jgi:hypothetical protein
MLIGTLNLVQGKNSRRLPRDICGKSCPTKKASSSFEAHLAIKSIWLAASTIWCAQNNVKHVKTKAEKRNIEKAPLDHTITTLLRSLHRKIIHYPHAPIGNKHPIPATNMWLRLSHLQLDRYENSMQRFGTIDYSIQHPPPLQSIPPTHHQIKIFSHTTDSKGSSWNCPVCVIPINMDWYL